MPTETIDHGLEPEAFASLGVADVAYIKPVTLDGESTFAIFAADGSQLAVAPSRELALLAIRSHDMEAVGLH